LTFKTLPSEGYDGAIPEFPQPTVFGNELHYWNWAWRTPQAALWSTAQWSWVLLTVADWCSLKAQAENPDAPVAVRGAIKALEAKILLDHIELNRAGYAIAVDEVAEARDSRKPARASARDRMQVIDGTRG
jgi:hypothetical protein